MDHGIIQLNFMKLRFSGFQFSLFTIQNNKLADGLHNNINDGIDNYRNTG